ncbi:uncharacterized protein PAC_16495 [Phialocephala subalpina]|uniref:Uncharacterized protein n=1 Tax=Phialocephala subalpina TaxID=576137 RepID=A0A1L7XNK2_9HELO|nr:uncharacterized protein PAC_16495 [Phialocephala subalpina]
MSGMYQEGNTTRKENHTDWKNATIGENSAFRNVNSTTDNCDMFPILLHVSITTTFVLALSDMFVSPQLSQATRSLDLIFIPEWLASVLTKHPTTFENVAQLHKPSRTLLPLHHRLYLYNSFLAFEHHNEESDDSPTSISQSAAKDSKQEGPQLSYMLRVCQPETTPAQAVDWLKIDDLHNQIDTERDILFERDWEAFSDLAVIKLPEPNPRKGQIFASRAKELAGELHCINDDVNLAKFAAPMPNLKRKEMAEGALKALDEFVDEKTGSRMGFLYQDLVEECASTIDQYYQDRKAALVPNANEEDSWPAMESTSSDILIKQRKEKGKTRPPHSSIFDMTPIPPPTAPANDPQEKIKVKPSTLRTFEMFFTRAVAVGPIWFEELESAMKDLKFNEEGIGGSRFNFHPTADTPVPHRSIQFHRPDIEGHIRFRFAYRLRRKYGLELGALEA